MIKILAIDDQKDNLISLTAIIRDAFPDSTIYTAPDGMTGIDLAISKDPDVIILDIIMPGMDGFEVCRRLKSDDRASNIPVVFLTALGGDRKIRIKAFDAGAEAFLSKPIDETELKAQIRAMCIIKTHYQLKKNEKEYLTAQIAARTAQLQKELCEKEWIEKALRESEYFFKESQRAAFIGSYKFDLRSDYWTSSDILKQIFGIDQNYGTSLVGWLDITHPDDREMMAKYFAEEVVGKRKPFNKEYRIIRKSDGETRWVLGLGSLNFDSDNNVTEMLGTIQDITERKLADERLRESNELNDTLLHTIPFGMDIVDTDGNVLFINDNLKQMVDKDFVGKKCWNLYKDDETQCGGCPLIKGVDLGETSSYETSRVLGGKTFQISHTGMMFQGRKAMLEIFQDITERKEVEKRIKLLAHSMESISECVSVTDNNDKIIYVNKSFLHTYGYTLEELIGQHTSILRSPDIRQEHVRDILPETIEGGWRGEIMNRKKDGTLFPILLSTSIIKDDEDQAIALIGVAIDITDMRKSRDELLAAKELAEENNSLKTAFLNNMSHEIRTPMNHIMGFSSLMKEAHADEKDAYADIILKSSNQLLTLIEDVILLSRLQSEKIRVEKNELNPATLIDNVLRIFEQNELKSAVKLHSGVATNLRQIMIVSDLMKIKNILTNLTSNAIKYTLEGNIEVGFEINLDKITFFVKDTGIGIQSKEQDKIFESFYRGEQALSMVIGGTGLGLSIVKELVDSMNGTLKVESKPGKGSAFSFSIPLEYAEASRFNRLDAPIVRKQLKEMNLLVADDEQINFRYMDVLLRNAVKQLDHAIDGSAAVKMAIENRYDMILMDMKMPVMDGFDASLRIKQKFPFVPIIALTAYASAEDIERAKDAGCDDFIAKPIKREVLFEVIRKYS